MNKFTMNDLLFWNRFSPVRKHKMEAMEMEEKDNRYREPKVRHGAEERLIKETIENTQIYKEAKEYILNAAQYEQVGYGISKYPEPLNADTWTTIETIDHIIGESVDKLHYLVMLRIKLLRQLEEEKNSKCEDSKDFGETAGRVKHQEDNVPKSVNDLRREFPPYGCEPTGTDCHVKIGSDYYPAKFIEIYQYSDIMGESPMIGGHRGGVVSYPVAVVRYGALLKQFKLSDVIFDEVSV